MVKKLKISEAYSDSKPIKFYYKGDLIFEGDKYDLWDVKDKFISICQRDNGLTDSIIDYCNSFGDPLLSDSETDLREIVDTFFEVVIAEANDYEYDDNELYVDDVKDVEIFTESKSMCEAGRMVNGKVSDLSTQYDSRKSFGGKAKVVTDADGTQILYSYNTPVVEIEKGKKVKLLPQWNASATTLRHVKEFLLQNGFEAGSKAQIAKLYSNVTESRKRRFSRRLKENNKWSSWKETPFSLFYDGEKHTLSKYTKDKFGEHPKMVLPQYNRETDTLYYIGIIDGEDVGEKFMNSGEAIDYLDSYYTYGNVRESLLNADDIDESSLEYALEKKSWKTCF